MTSADLAAMAERGTLADGTPWPIPVTLEVPEDAVPAGASHLVLQDQEGTPLAVLQIPDAIAWSLPARRQPGCGRGAPDPPLARRAGLAARGRRTP